MKKARYSPADEMEHVIALLMPQNQLVARVALETGLRVGDIVSLRESALKPTMRIKQSKTGKFVTVRVSRPLLRALRANCSGGWVFPGRKPGTHRARQSVWKDVARARRALRLRGTVSPHTWRKVYAVELYRKYGDIETVQKALGHENPLVTTLYALADTLTAKAR